MIWVTLIMGLLSLLLQWLNGKQKAGATLTADEQKKLNGVVFRAQQVSAACVALGCKPGGEPPEPQVDAGIDLEKLRQFVEKK